MNQLINRIPNRSTNYAGIDNSDTYVIHGGDSLFRMGDQLDGIFMINSGTVRLSRISESGDEQIIGFYMSGDLVGLDALGDGRSRSTAILLETSNISLIPFNALENGTGRVDYSTFIRQVGKRFNRDNEHVMMLSHCTASRRVAWFLISLSDALANRGLQSTEFIMTMTRSDIALFLGITIETVCRELSHLCDKKLIKKDRRHIELLDIDSLRGLINGDDTMSDQMEQTSKAS